MKKALQHIKNECDFIISNTRHKSRQEIVHDPLLSRATIWSLEIIGEATKKLNPDFTKQFPKTDWKYLASMREKLFHDSIKIDYDIVCDIAYNNVPELLQELNKIIESEKK